MKTKIFMIFAAVLCLCALCAVAVSAENAPETDIVAHSLSLNDSVNIVYYADFQNVPENAEKGILIWTSAQDEYIYGSENAKLTNVRGISAGYTTYAFTGVSAKMMSQDIYAKSYIKVGDDITYGPLDKYSVLQYAYNKKGSTSVIVNNGTTLGELLVGLLDYGTLAQTYFGYNLDRLANATYYKIDVVNGTLVDGTTSGLYVSGETATLVTDIAKFDHWENSNGENVGNTAMLNITVTENETYSAVADIYSKGLEFTSNGDGTCYVSDIGTCTDTYVLIPKKSPAGDVVTGVGNGEWINERFTGFYGRYNVKTIVIPDTVTNIGGGALAYCGINEIISLSPNFAVVQNCLIEVSTGTLVAGLSNSVIPTDGSVTSIKNSAFLGCSSLKVIEIPDSVTSIGSSAFRGCSNLTNITIPSSVTYIGVGVLSICDKLESIVSESVMYPAIQNCLIEIDTGTLIASCKNSVLPTDGSVKIIGSTVFRYNTNLTNLEIPSSVTNIGDYAFANCTSLTSVIFEENSEIALIGERAFWKCMALESIELPYGVTSIEWNTFGDCTSLTTIKIPKSVTDIKWSALQGCTSLSKIIFAGTEEEWNAIEKYSNWDSNTGNYTLVFDSEIAYSKGLEFISNGDGTCYVNDIGDCEDTDIVIPSVSPDGDIVTNIGGSAFSGCGIISITIPNSVTSIGEKAFRGCSALEEIIFLGTESEWNAIEKGDNWDKNAGDYKLTFTQQTEEHTFGDWNEEVPATCANDGVKGHYTCSTCQKYFDAEYNEISDLTIPAEHILGEMVYTMPGTCVEDSYTYKICTVCGTKEVIAYGAKDPNNHDFSDWIVYKAPTCYTEGMEKSFCGYGCGKIESRSVAIDPTAHPDDAWIPLVNANGEEVIKPANCVSPAQRVMICQYCGDTDVEIVPGSKPLPLNTLDSHINTNFNYSQTALVAITRIAPTCTIEGRKEFEYCSLCRTYITIEGEDVFENKWSYFTNPELVIIPALGHDFETAAGIEPDCFNAGQYPLVRCTRESCAYKRGFTVNETIALIEVGDLELDFDIVNLPGTFCLNGAVRKAYKHDKIAEKKLVDGDKLSENPLAYEVYLEDEDFQAKQFALSIRVRKDDNGNDDVETILDNENNIIGYRYHLDWVEPTCQREGYIVGKYCLRCAEVYGNYDLFFEEAFNFTGYRIAVLLN